MDTTDANRPAGRSRLSPEREAELFEAVLELIREEGYDALTMDAVAARARSSKATLYRRWEGKPQLVAEAVRKHKSFTLTDLDTGSLRGDLYEIVDRVGSAKKNLDVMRALGPAMRRHEDLAEAMRQAMVDPELAVIRSVVQRAVARGELAPDCPASEYLPHMLLGAVFCRPFVERREADATYLEHYLDSVVLPALMRD